MASPMSTATYEAAFTKKQIPRPNRTITTPPMAGPTTREAFMTTVLRLTALGRSSRPTISITKVWRAGIVEHVDETEQRGQEVDLPELDGVGDDQRTEHQGQQAAGGLGGSRAAFAC